MGTGDAADEDAVKVTTANYWEGELGLLAAEKGTTEAVRRAGRARSLASIRATSGTA